MQKIRKVLITVVILVLTVGAAALSYYTYESRYFFTTEDAQVTARMVALTPEVTGKLRNWEVREGDYVRSGQVLGTQDVNNSASSPSAALTNAEIKSPIDGKVIQTNVVKGQVVAPGLEIATIADTSNVYIKANIEETDIFRIQPGQPVDIRIDAYPGREFKGLVRSIGQATNSAFSQFPSLNTSGTFSKVTQLIPVEITLLDVDNLPLMIGMNATVKIHIR